MPVGRGKTKPIVCSLLLGVWVTAGFGQRQRTFCFPLSELLGAILSQLQSKESWEQPARSQRVIRCFGMMDEIHQHSSCLPDFGVVKKLNIKMLCIALLLFPSFFFTIFSSPGKSHRAGQAAKTLASFPLISGKVWISHPCYSLHNHRPHVPSRGPEGSWIMGILSKSDPPG